MANPISTVKQAIATDPTGIRRNIREYQEQLYPCKLNNLNKMDQLLKNDYYNTNPI